MHWTHYLSTMKINEWRRVHHSKLLKTPVCTSKEFYREGDFVKPFSALTCSSEWMLIPLTAFCCCEYKPVESRAQIKAVRVQWNQKVLLIFVSYRKRRRVMVSLLQSRNAQKSHPAGKRYCHLCNEFDTNCLTFPVESNLENRVCLSIVCLYVWKLVLC